MIGLDLTLCSCILMIKLGQIRWVNAHHLIAQPPWLLVSPCFFLDFLSTMCWFLSSIPSHSGASQRSRRKRSHKIPAGSRWTTWMPWKRGHDAWWSSFRSKMPKWIVGTPNDLGWDLHRCWFTTFLLYHTSGSKPISWHSGCGRPDDQRLRHSMWRLKLRWQLSINVNNVDVCICTCMCIYIYMYVYIHVYSMCIYIYIYVFVLSVHVCVFVHMCVYIYTVCNIYIYLQYIYMYTRISIIHMYTHICIVHMYIIYIYMYIYA